MSLKKLVGLLLVAFFLFFLVQSPANAAQVVKSAGESLGDFFGAFAEEFSKFLSQLF
nr:hypothetical protein [Actinomycetota bacterium]